MKKLSAVFTTLLLSFFVCGVGMAAPVVSVGDYEVLKGGVVNVSVDLSGSSGFNIDTFSLRVQLNMTDLEATDPAPGNAGLNTMWFQGRVRQAEEDVSFFYSVFAGEKPVLSDGTLATFDITDIANKVGNTYSLKLIDVALSQGTTPVDEFEIKDGSIAVVPIPSAILLLGGGLIGLIAVRRRRS